MWREKGDGRELVYSFWRQVGSLSCGFSLGEEVEGGGPGKVGETWTGWRKEGA